MSCEISPSERSLKGPMRVVLGLAALIASLTGCKAIENAGNVGPLSTQVTTDGRNATIEVHPLGEDPLKSLDGIRGPVVLVDLGLLAAFGFLFKKGKRVQ